MKKYRGGPLGRRGVSVGGTQGGGLFLAGLLDALLAGVQGAFLALGRLQHFLLRLGGYESNGQQETNTKQYDNTYQPAASA